MSRASEWADWALAHARHGANDPGPLMFVARDRPRAHRVAVVRWTDAGPYLATKPQHLAPHEAIAFAQWILDTFGEAPQ